MEQLKKLPHHILRKSGSYQIAMDDECLIEIDERIHVQIYLTYDKEQLHQKLNVIVKAEAQADVLIFCENAVSGTASHYLQVMKDATLHIGYGELQTGSMDLKVVCDLMESGAKAKLLHATLASEHKHYQITCNHLSPHTEGIMDNYAVVGENGNYQMEAVGRIIKGAYGSASHQHTHVLTMSEKHRSEVIPLLLIDENDVEASHAMSLGQPDREQLYYLQSRGLSYQQALGLLMLGYILPLCELVQEDALRTQLQEIIEKKVGLYA